MDLQVFPVFNTPDDLAYIFMSYCQCCLHAVTLVISDI